MVFVEYNYFVGRYKNFFGELSDENNEFVFLRFWKFWKENLKYFIGVCFFNYNYKRRCMYWKVFVCVSNNRKSKFWKLYLDCEN